jgi:predicted nuclease of predicted toxin-antitoxin system
VSQTAPLRVVLDQGVPRDAANRLREVGYVCTHVGEIGMSTATDREILAFAEGQRAIIVTLDADFHTIIAVSGLSTPSVIRLRLQGLNALAITAIVEEVFSSFAGQLERGCLVTVKTKKITCRMLPIGGKSD